MILAITAFLSVTSEPGRLSPRPFSFNPSLDHEKKLGVREKEAGKLGTKFPVQSLAFRIGLPLEGTGVEFRATGY